MGISHSYAYFGSFSSVFFPHVENGGFCSINILVFGAPKIWHFCAPEDAAIVEKVIAKKMGRKCHHDAKKAVPLHPQELIKAGVRLFQVRYIYLIDLRSRIFIITLGTTDISYSYQF